MQNLQFQQQAQQQLDQSRQMQLQMFWHSQTIKIQQINPEENEFKVHPLPLARIKKIMKTDDNVKMISAETPILFAKACELFINDLTKRAWHSAHDNKRRTLQKPDVSSAAASADEYDFLVDIVPRPDTFPGHSGSQSNGNVQGGVGMGGLSNEQLRYILDQAQQQQQDQQPAQRSSQLGSGRPPSGATLNTPSQPQLVPQQQTLNHHNSQSVSPPMSLQQSATTTNSSAHQRSKATPTDSTGAASPGDVGGIMNLVAGGIPDLTPFGFPGFALDASGQIVPSQTPSPESAAKPSVDGMFGLDPSLLQTYEQLLLQQQQQLFGLPNVSESTAPSSGTDNRNMNPQTVSDANARLKAAVTAGATSAVSLEPGRPKTSTGPSVDSSVAQQPTVPGLEAWAGGGMGSVLPTLASGTGPNATGNASNSSIAAADAEMQALLLQQQLFNPLLMPGSLNTGHGGDPQMGKGAATSNAGVPSQQQLLQQQQQLLQLQAALAQPGDISGSQGVGSQQQQAQLMAMLGLLPMAPVPMSTDTLATVGAATSTKATSATQEVAAAAPPNSNRRNDTSRKSKSGRKRAIVDV